MILYQTGTLQVVGNGPMVTYGRIVSRYDERKERIVNYWGKNAATAFWNRGVRSFTVRWRTAG